MYCNSTKNLLINAAGELIANQIGQAAKPSIVVDNQGNIISYKSALITQTTQLSLHAALGCAMASAGGNNCASGAAAGVMGELTANYLDNNTNLSNQQIIETSKLTGAITAAAISGSDDGNSVFAGSQIARNAAENNELLFAGKYKIPLTDSIKTRDGKDYDIHAGVQGQLLFTEFSAGSDGVGKAGSVIPQIGVGIYGNVIPHDQQVQTTISYGFKNQFSIDKLKTYQGGNGIGFSFGKSTASQTILPINLTVDIPNKK